MADLQDMLLFERYYGKANEITERIALPRNNPDLLCSSFYF